MMGDIDEGFEDEVYPAKPPPRTPKWTLIYYIKAPNSYWLGCGYMFFDDYNAAFQQFESIGAGREPEKVTPCLRPYHSGDKANLAVVHRLNREG